jgi:hypothetical protein
MANTKFLQYFNKFSLAGRWSFALACIPLGIVLFIALLLFIFISGAEMFPRGFASTIFILGAIQVMPVTSIIGVVLGAKASIRNKCRIGMTGLILNLLILIGCFPVLKFRYGDDIAWLFSVEHRLEKAINKGDVEAVKKYIQKGADTNFVNRREETALQCAISSRNIEILKILLNSRADVNKKDRLSDVTPLHHLLLTSADNRPPAPDDWDDLEAARLLLEQGANPNVCGWDKTPLLIAAEQENEEMVDLLLSYGADINQVGRLVPSLSGYSALHYAAEKGDTKLALLLLDKGADVNIKGTGDISPLHLASSGPMIELLLSKGADPNALDRFGQPALKTEKNTIN